MCQLNISIRALKAAIQIEMDKFIFQLLEENASLTSSVTRPSTFHNKNMCSKTDLSKAEPRSDLDDRCYNYKTQMD